MKYKCYSEKSYNYEIGVMEGEKKRPLQSKSNKSRCSVTLGMERQFLKPWLRNSFVFPAFSLKVRCIFD